MMDQLAGRLRSFIFRENMRGSIDLEIYPTVVVSLGVMAWGAMILLRKARAELPTAREPPPPHIS